MSDLPLDAQYLAEFTRWFGLMRERSVDVQPTIDTTRERQDVAIDLAACQTMFDTDRTLFPLALRAKRVQRRWMQLTGRRYESLLPEHTTYGRPT
jgi:hypothetical protein